MASTSSGEIEFKYNLNLYFHFLRPYIFVFFIIIFFTFLQELHLIVEKYLFKIIIDKGVEFNNGLLVRDAFIHLGLLLLVIFIAVCIINMIAIWFRIHFLNRLESNIIQDMKLKFFKHILELDHNFHTTHKTGSLISRLSRGARAMEQLTDIISFNFMSLLVQVVIAVGAFIYFDSLSVVIVGFTVLSFILYSFYMQKVQESSNIIANKAEDSEKGNVSDFFTNVDSIKYYGNEKTINQRYKSLSENTKKSYLKNWDYARVLSVGQVFILSIGTLLLLYTTFFRFMGGELSLGTLVFIYTVYIGLIGNLFDFVGGLRGFYRAMADFQDLFQYNKLSNQIKDKSRAESLTVKKGTITFKDVSFTYGNRQIFKHFNLYVKENEKIALVGHSGSGKTTLIKLLKRFYDVDEGTVFIDGKDIRDFTQESVRSEIGIVPQECILFDDTIYNNILFANQHASHKEVLKAIRFAQLDTIINYFPQKEHTIVGERGVRLSGGEKQRVSIARAILANKKILVLDEATSSLDSETEHEIQKDLAALLKGRTSIIIAHRLSTIMNADRIIVMKQGTIVQEGTHQELIQKEGEYKKLWNLQKGGYIK